jgi:hypothetical protein
VDDPGGHPALTFRLFPALVPPYRFVGRVFRSSDARQVATHFLAERAPTESAFVTGGGEASLPAPGRVLHVSDRPSALELEVEGSGPGPSYLLVCRPLAATRAALVDGKRVEVDDANVGFTGLAIPPGRHVVRLQPRGGWLIIAAVFSALGVGALITLFRRGRSRGPSAR